MKKVFFVLFLTACSGAPFEAGDPETSSTGGSAGVSSVLEDSAPPCPGGPLCAYCSGVNFGGPGPGECTELIPLISEARFAQCMFNRCSFGCARPEITAGLCTTLGAECAYPPSAQSPFCLP